MKQISLKTQDGMTIIEVAISTAVLAVAGGALVVMGLMIVAMTTSVRNKARATAYATERVEQVRACRDKFNKLPTILGDCGLNASDTLGFFNRATALSGVDPVDVSVVVTWTEKGTTKTVTVKTKLAKPKINEATE